MPVPLIAWAAVGVVGLFGTGYAAKGLGEALEEANTATKLALLAGGAYASYRALRAAGALK